MDVIRILILTFWIIAVSSRGTEAQTPDDRIKCPAPDPVPVNRVDTTVEVAELRATMADTTLTKATGPLTAYLVYEGSYYGGGVTDHDRRMKFISGFSGSAGNVLVTIDKAALWTDGRYWLQADDEMDCQWILMKDGATGTPSSIDWLVSELPDNALVGADPNYMDTTTWLAYEAAFAEDNKGKQLVKVEDLFNFIWTAEDGRPEIINNLIYEHTVEYAGRSWEDKVENVVRVGFNGMADYLVVTLLDDIAWMFNLRGSDRKTSPLFDSFAILTQTTQTLYIRDVAKLLPAVRAHLNTGTGGSCSGATGVCVEVKEYDDFFDDLDNINSNLAAGKKIWINKGVSYAVYLAVDEDHRYEEYSPIQLPKSQKNEVEVSKYRDCQLRDSSYLVEFMAMLEYQMVQQGRTNWTELNADTELTKIRATDPAFRMPSFDTISAIGTNGAIIHYMPTEALSQPLTTTDMYLLDSGGNYLDGTTDVTRTFHFGTPTDEEIEAYTRVLMGVIDLATTVWPFGWKGSDIDARTRTPIWQNGWDFNHGTGHGIGYFLNVHEGPGRINVGYDPSHSPLYEHMFFSDEPGIYLDNKFGVRLETILEVVKANTANNFNGVDYMTFDPVTFVPFEPKLINMDLLDIHHIDWLNVYHETCVSTTGEYLLTRGKQQAYDWLISRTSPMSISSSASWMQVSTPAALLFVILVYLL